MLVPSLKDSLDCSKWVGDIERYLYAWWNRTAVKALRQNVFGWISNGIDVHDFL